MTDAAIHPPAPALRLFAARRRDPGQEARRPLHRRRHARRRAHRHRQPLRRARIFRNPRQGRHPADHGLPARPRLCRARPPRRPRPRPAARRPARPGRDRLRQPDEALLPQLPRLRRRPAARHPGAARRPRRRPHLPHRRRRGPARRPHPRRPRPPRPRARRAPRRRSSPAASTSRSSATPRTAPRARPAEEATEPGLVTLAYDLDLPLVATNDVQFPAASIYDAHDALLCIAEGAYVDQQAPRRRLTPEHRFKSQDEMVALFADLPEAVENTVEIARRCAFRPQKRKPILPRFAEDEVEELRRQAREGLAARLAVIPKSAPDETYAAAPRVRARRHRGHGLPRLLPHRRRLHQVGQGRTTSPSAPAAARAPARSSPTR